VAVVGAVVAAAVVGAVLDIGLVEIIVVAAGDTGAFGAVTTGTD
jgi:hypothetical protein